MEVAAAELSGTVTVKVAGDDVEAPRPAFRRLRPLLALDALGALGDLEQNEDGTVSGNLPLPAIIDMGEAIAEVLFGENADTYLDRIFTADQWAEFLSSAIDALHLGEALASTSS